MSGIYDLTGKNIENTYQRVVQTPDGVNFFDGTGSAVTFTATATAGGSNTQIQFNSASLLSGSSKLTFDYVANALTLTGSFNVTGSTLQVGNNTLYGNTLLSGSLTISGSHLSNTPTIKIYGDVETDGVIKFLPVNYDIDPTISGSYIFVSGSTDDLYFSQNGAGFSNVTRLRWIEGNLYTGLLNGGIVSQVNSNTYKISSGSGIVVNLNASYNNNPYPIVQYLNWGNLTNTIDALSGSYDQQFVAISSSAGTVVIKAQGTPYNDGDYNNFIPIGIVIHQNRSSINAVQTFPGVAYGWKQRSYDFIKAFGPLKIAGYTLAQSGSSTRGLVLSGGTAWVDGRNYIVDPNNPSYIVEATGITTSKIYRYRQSGSGWAYDTNGGAGYTDIDPTQYSNSGSLTPVGTNDWTIQRVFYFPNSATKAFYIYYGNTTYSSKDNAIAGILTEPFNEAPNTAANAIFVGYMILRYNASFNTAASYEFRAGGLFRGSGIGGAGGGGGGGATTLAGLTDVSLSSLTYGDLLMYNASTGLWNNTHTLSGSYILTGSLTTNDGLSVQTVTASFISASGGITGSLFGTASYALNGGVTQLLAGSNITLSPANGLGQVTINSTGGGGGNTATGSYGSFFSTQTQNAGAINTPYSMSLNNIDITNGVTISGSTSSSIKIANAGVYDLQFSAQLQKAGSGGGVANVLIWLRKNNIDLSSTNTYVQLQGGTNSKTVAAWNWFLNAAAEDEYRIMWSTDDTNAQLYYDPAPITGPAVPSVIATVARVDQFLSNTGSFTGSFTGQLIGTASYSTVASASTIINDTNSNFGFLVFTNATSSGVNSVSTQSLRNTSRNIRISPTGDALLAQSIGTNQIYPINTSSFAANLVGTLTAFGNWTFNNTINGTASYANTSSQAISSSYAISASWAPGSTPPSIYDGNAGTSYPNLATLYVSGSGVTVSSPASGIVSMSISGGGGGGGSTSPGEPNTSIQFNSGSTFSGSANLTYQYNTSAIDSQRLTFQSSYDFATNVFNKNYPASFFINNNFNTVKQQAGLSHWQYSLAANTGATTIYKFDANGDTPSGNLRMYGFKCDYSLLLRDTSPVNAASRVGTLIGAWSYDNTINPVITDTYVDGDQVYNQLGTVVFTLVWNGRDIELQMDCTNVSNGDTYFNGLFTNFGTSL